MFGQIVRIVEKSLFVKNYMEQMRKTRLRYSRTREDMRYEDMPVKKVRV